MYRITSILLEDGDVIDKRENRQDFINEEIAKIHLKKLLRGKNISEESEKIIEKDDDGEIVAVHEIKWTTTHENQSKLF